MATNLSQGILSSNNQRTAFRTSNVLNQQNYKDWGQNKVTKTIRAGQWNPQRQGMQFPSMLGTGQPGIPKLPVHTQLGNTVYNAHPHTLSPHLQQQPVAFQGAVREMIIEDSVGQSRESSTSMPSLTRSEVNRAMGPNNLNSPNPTQSMDDVIGSEDQLKKSLQELMAQRDHIKGSVDSLKSVGHLVGKSASDSMVQDLNRTLKMLNLKIHAVESNLKYQETLRAMNDGKDQEEAVETPLIGTTFNMNQEDHGGMQQPQRRQDDQDIGDRADSQQQHHNVQQQSQENSNGRNQGGNQGSNQRERSGPNTMGGVKGANNRGNQSAVPVHLLEEYQQRQEEYNAEFDRYTRYINEPVEYGEAGLPQREWRKDDIPRPTDFYDPDKYIEGSPYFDPDMRDRKGDPPSLFWEDEYGELLNLDVRLTSMCRRGKLNGRWRSRNPLYDGVPVGSHPAVTQLSGISFLGWVPGSYSGDGGRMQFVDLFCSLCGHHGHIGKNCVRYKKLEAIRGNNVIENTVEWARDENYSFSIIKPSNKIYLYIFKEPYGAPQKARWASAHNFRTNDRMAEELELEEVPMIDWERHPTLVLAAVKRDAAAQEINKFGNTKFMIKGMLAPWGESKGTSEPSPNLTPSVKSPKGFKQHSVTDNITKEQMRTRMQAKRKMLEEEGFELNVNDRYVTYSTRSLEPVVTVVFREIPRDKMTTVDAQYGATLAKLSKKSGLFRMITMASRSVEVAPSKSHPKTATMRVELSMKCLKRWLPSLSQEELNGDHTGLDLMIDKIKNGLARISKAESEKDKITLMIIAKQLFTTHFGLNTMMSDHFCKFQTEIPMGRTQSDGKDDQLESLWLDLRSRFNAETCEISAKRMGSRPSRKVLVAISMDIVLGVLFEDIYDEEESRLRFFSKRSMTYRELWANERASTTMKETLQKKRDRHQERMQRYYEQEMELQQRVQEEAQNDTVMMTERVTENRARDQHQRVSKETEEELQEVLRALNDSGNEPVSLEDVLSIAQSEMDEQSLKKDMQHFFGNDNDDSKGNETFYGESGLKEYINHIHKKGMVDQSKGVKGGAQGVGHVGGRPVSAQKGNHSGDRMETDKELIARYERQRKQEKKNKTDFLRGESRTEYLPNRRCSKRRQRRLEQNERFLSIRMAQHGFREAVPPLAEKWRKGDPEKIRKRSWAQQWVRKCEEIMMVMDSARKMKMDPLDAVTDFLLDPEELGEDGEKMYRYLYQMFVLRSAQSNWYCPEFLYADDTDSEDDNGDDGDDSKGHRRLRDLIQPEKHRYDDTMSVINMAEFEEDEHKAETMETTPLISARYTRDEAYTLNNNNNKEVVIRNFKGKITGLSHVADDNGKKWGV